MLPEVVVSRPKMTIMLPQEAQEQECGATPMQAVPTTPPSGALPVPELVPAPQTSVSQLPVLDHPELAPSTLGICPI